ncbi:PAS domain S-box protein [Coleofasciculus sp. FACHB-1120]|uniref:PAS domain S-box protein n=1 Tax=Coleofasciculus sp. FACHB-1120 TaxID=2692783 RepID=UPI001682BFEE|nr:PAS domain S-box protein [Coleofasciculus sp. FACHB-1120]MBD2743031.1 PAS domain S-box protein [Coleofasciculus sp. FACHB-1120]
MLEFLNVFFTSGGFIPHGHCYLWKPGLVWLHIVSDSLIALAYYSIPVTLFYFVRKRQDLPFDWIFLLFGSFIIACGTTHVMEIWTLWHPTYWLSGFIKAITALVSVYTAASLVQLVPKALALPSPAVLEATNRELETQIAYRLQMEEALQASEERFRSAFDYAAVGMALVATDGRWLEVNRSLCEIVGYSEQELLATNFPAITHPDDLETNLEYMRQMLAGKIQHYNVEKRYLHKQGHIVWIFLSASLVHNAKGEPLFNAQIQDITQRKLAEEERKASQARLAGILDIAEDAIISVNETQQITLFNQGAEKIFGYTASEVIGQSLDLLLPKRAAIAHRQHIRNFDTSVGNARKMGERNEVFGQRKNGVEFPAEASISKLELAGEKIFTVILRDITERKRGEEALSQLASIVESSEDAIVGKTLDGIITSWNSGAERIYGYTAQEVKGQPISILLPPDRFNEMASILARIKQGERIPPYESVRFRKDGSQIDVAITISPIKNRAGQVTGASAIARDVSDRRAIERLKDEFVSIVSHELRTPLTSIRGALGLLAGGLLMAKPEKAQRMLEIAVSNTDRLVRLINDILDIERIESGQVAMEHQICDAATLMLQASEVMRAMADKAGVTLCVSPLSAQLYADPDRIIQTLTNLLSNAIKFSPPSSSVYLSAEIQQTAEPVKTRFLAPGAGEGGTEKEFTPSPPQPLTLTVLFKVKDQGRGIPAEKLENVFERFQQVDASDSRDKGGTGLGLAICRSIVQQHGGRIWVESTLNEGSTFFFTLPLLSGETRMLNAEDERENLSEGDVTTALAQSSLATQDGAVPLPSDADNALGTPLVLVCDDEPAVCTVVQTLLEQRGYQVKTAFSGQEAVELALQEQPAVILLDLIMPGMNGWQTMAVLKQRPDTREIPIVIFSVLSPEQSNFLKSSLENQTLSSLLEGDLLQTDLGQLQPSAPSDAIASNSITMENAAGSNIDSADSPINDISPQVSLPPNSDDDKPRPPDFTGWVRKPLNEASLFQALEQSLQQAKVAKVLLVEDDLDLARVLIARFERHGLETIHAKNGREAIQKLATMNPNLLVLDIVLPEYDGFAVVDWLRQCNRLRHIPIVVYSAKDLNNAERERLQLEQTEFLTKGRITPEQFEGRIIALLNRIVPNRKENSNGDNEAHPGN